jgi:hypothetical protein
MLFACYSVTASQLKQQDVYFTTTSFQVVLEEDAQWDDFDGNKSVESGGGEGRTCVRACVRACVHACTRRLICPLLPNDQLRDHTGKKAKYWLILKEIIRAAPCFFLRVLAWY